MQTEDEKAFIKKLNGREFGKGEREKFLDFLELGYCAFAKPMANPDCAEKLEERYMRIVNSYRDKDAVRAYPELFGLVAKNVPHSDFLGSIAATIGALNSTQGQFFTPYHLSLLLAQLSFQDSEKTIAEKGYVRLQEPASGAGGMVLAFAETMLQRGYNPTKQLFVNAVDVSSACYWMTYLQLTLAGIPAQVIHGNTLSLDIFESAYTRPSLNFFDQHGNIFTPEEKSEPLKPAVTATAFMLLEMKQLALF